MYINLMYPRVFFQFVVFNIFFTIFEVPVTVRLFIVFAIRPSTLVEGPTSPPVSYVVTKARVHFHFENS